MNRRSFIKKGSLFVPMLLLPSKTSAQSIYKLHNRRSFRFPTANLISYWQLNETSGTRIDSVTATGNDLTDNNTVTSNPGKIGNAAQFTAANSEYLSHVDNASLSTGDIDFMIAAWVYLDAASAVVRRIVSKRAAANNMDYDLYCNTAGGGFFSFTIGDSGGSTVTVDASNFGSPSLSTWYFVAAWHDSVANTLNISVNNGTPNSITTGAVVPNDSTGTFMIGELQQVSRPWSGRIDEVGFWKRQLTAAEITTLYNGGAGITPPF